jgi:malate dehydrogenase (oxaloacetate-decarboxylating)(NADP+)
MLTPDRRKLCEVALECHEFSIPGKISLAATKSMTSQRDLALAYSPGVATACEGIVTNPLRASRFTARSNLVGVVTNGTAALARGNIGLGHQSQ